MCKIINYSVNVIFLFEHPNRRKPFRNNINVPTAHDYRININFTFILLLYGSMPLFFNG